MEKKDNNVSEVLSQYSHKELQDLLMRMRGYVQDKINFRKINIDGLEPLDFVMSVFDKSLQGIRNWDVEKCDFENFVFGVLKSEISAELTKRKRRRNVIKEEVADESYIMDIPVVGAESAGFDPAFDNMDNESMKQTFYKMLKDAGADNMELMLFECWCENIYKPDEIAEILDTDPVTIYKTQKRLQRRRKKIIKINE